MAQGVVKSYRKSRAGGVETIRVLDELDLAVAAGESVAIRGQSGIGKTTLLNVLGGLDRADAGSVLHEGEAIPSQADARARWRRGRVGFIFQFHGLLPEFSALENAALAGMVAGVERGVSFARAAELLDSVGLGPRLDHHPDELSGGEQQRVAVARALVARPRLVLADEPTGNLDPKTGDQVLDHLFALQDEHHFALLVASHSQALAARCDRVLRLSEGRLAPDPAFPPGGDDVHHGRVSS